MKAITRTLLVLLVLIIMWQTASGQTLVVGLLAEKTISNTELGALLMYETKKAAGVGVFYQYDGFDSERKFDNGFYGGIVQLPLVNARKIIFSGVLRAGLVNREFFFVTPSLETKINVSQRLSLVAAMGLRKTYPALSGKILYRLF